jgi:putative tryptophan/tyrosine transport system substrate-binding protein
VSSTDHGGGIIAVSEPVALDLVASLAHPGGNITGFSNLEPTLGAKWLGLLKQIAPIGP